MTDLLTHILGDFIFHCIKDKSFANRIFDIIWNKYGNTYVDQYEKNPNILLVNFIANRSIIARSRFLLLRLSRSIPDWYCKTRTCLSCILVEHALGIHFIHGKIFLFQEAEHARNPYFDGPHNKVAAKKGSYYPRHQWIGPNP